MDMNCPNCNEKISWNTLNDNMSLASDASFIQIEVKCPKCNRDLSITYDISKFGLEVIE
jgi:endogenous inhibitor of DNA gyrase (YacG/DUF329 family)